MLTATNLRAKKTHFQWMLSRASLISTLLAHSLQKERQKTTPYGQLKAAILL